MVQIIKRGSERAPAVSYALAVIRRSQTVYARSMAFFAVLHDVQALEDVDGRVQKRRSQRARCVPYMLRARHLAAAS